MLRKALSVVIPAKNEAENLDLLTDDISKSLSEAGYEFEIIVVDDGSTDNTIERLNKKRDKIPSLKLLSHDRSGGQSAAVHSGVTVAQYEIICTLDGDGQNPASELPNIAAPFFQPQAEKIGLVAGQRVKRQDTFSKRYASKAANTIRSFILKDETRDTGCGLKAFRKEAFLALPYFDHMHRYLPALFSMAGYEVAHVDVSHRERQEGKSNYSNFQRALVGIVDLFGVAWLIKRHKKAKAQDVTDYQK